MSHHVWKCLVLRRHSLEFFGTKIYNWVWCWVINKYYARKNKGCREFSRHFDFEKFIFFIIFQKDRLLKSNNLEAVVEGAQRMSPDKDRMILTALQNCCFYLLVFVCDIIFSPLFCIKSQIWWVWSPHPLFMLIRIFVIWWKDDINI